MYQLYNNYMRHPSCRLIVMGVMIMLRKINIRIFLGGQKSIMSKYKREVACSILCVLLLLGLSGSVQATPAGMGQYSSKNGRDASTVSRAGSMDRPTRLIISAIHLDAAVEMV